MAAFVPVGSDIKSNLSESSASPTASNAGAQKTSVTRNKNLDSFEAVMQAMERELAKHKPPRATDAAKAPAASDMMQASRIEGDDGEGIEAALDRELHASLVRDDDEGEELEQETDPKYNLIKNFLESYKSQDGLSGPVSNLAGRLQPGWKLPRDKS